MSRVVSVTALIERISGTREHPLDRLTSSRRRPRSVTGARVGQRGRSLNLELDDRLKRATLRLVSRCESLGDRNKKLPSLRDDEDLR
jgi:hypothetical protein